MIKAALLGLTLFSTFSTFAAEFQGYQILDSASESKSLPTILVPPYKLYPTQITLGQAAVRDMIINRLGSNLFRGLNLKWDEKKDYEANVRSLSKDDLQKYLAELQKKINKTPFDGAFTPTGIFHFDGHHRSRALYEINQILAKITTDPKVRVFVPIKLRINYANSGITEKDIARDIFITRAQGYVPDSLVGIKPGMDSVDIAVLKLNYLQKKAPHLGALTDNPYRSLIGAALDVADINSSTFVTYFEFHLQDLLKEKIDKVVGAKGVYPGMPINDELVGKVRSLIFSDKDLLGKIAYWARLGNLSKEQAYQRCLMLEKKDDKTQTTQENSDEKVCKGNREQLFKAYLK